MQFSWNLLENESNQTKEAIRIEQAKPHEEMPSQVKLLASVVREQASQSQCAQAKQTKHRTESKQVSEHASYIKQIKPGEASLIGQAKPFQQTSSQIKFGPCERSELCELASQAQYSQAKQSKVKYAKQWKPYMQIKANRSKEASKLSKT